MYPGWVIRSSPFQCRLYNLLFNDWVPVHFSTKKRREEVSASSDHQFNSCMRSFSSRLAHLSALNLSLSNDMAGWIVGFVGLKWSWWWWKEVFFIIWVFFMSIFILLTEKVSFLDKKWWMNFEWTQYVYK